MQFKYTFNHLPKKDKILSFLLVPLVLFLIYFFIDKYFIPKDEANINQNIKVLKLAIKQLKNKKNKIDQLAVIRYIEHLALDLNIRIENTKINKKSFDIQTIGNYSDSMNFIYNLEQSMKINLLTISKDDKQNISIHCTFIIKDLQKNQNLQSLENLPNPFVQTKNYTKNGIFNLIAIIGENVCINDKWYVKDDLIGKHKLIKVSKYMVELRYKNKIIKLELEKDDI